MKGTQEKPAIDATKISSANWYSWINTMPPPPDDFHVVGDVEVPNPGVRAELIYRVPQNPKILLLDLHLVQQPGIWPQVLSSVTARYDKVLAPKNVRYEQVQIFFLNQVIETLDVDIIK